MFIFYGPYCGLYWARCHIAIHGCKDLMYSQIDGFSEAKQSTEYTTVLFMLLVYCGVLPCDNLSPRADALHALFLSLMFCCVPHCVFANVLVLCPIVGCFCLGGHDLFFRRADT